LRPQFLKYIALSWNYEHVLHTHEEGNAEA